MQTSIRFRFLPQFDLFFFFHLGPDSKGHQLSCVCLHGDRKPNERKNNLERFKVLNKNNNENKDYK